MKCNFTVILYGMKNKNKNKNKKQKKKTNKQKTPKKYIMVLGQPVSPAVAVCEWCRLKSDPDPTPVGVTWFQLDLKFAISWLCTLWLPEHVKIPIL